MSAIGAKTLLVAAGAVSVGIGAGFERSLQDSWKTSTLPAVSTQAQFAPVPKPQPPAAFAPRTTAAEQKVDRRSRAQVVLPETPPSAPSVAAVESTQLKRQPVQRTVEKPIIVADNAITPATATPIVANSDDKPTDVPPDVAAVQGAPIDAESVQAPVTPTPEPTATPTPTPPPKKPWLHRQLQHLNPFKTKP